MRSGKPSWQRKLDKLKVRAKRAAVNMNALPMEGDSEDIVKKVRATGQLTLAEALAQPSFQEARRRLAAVETEHELMTYVLGCRVSLTLYANEGKLSYGLAISHVDKRRPRIDGWNKPPRKFERIRKYIGAPERVMAKGTVALHWQWDVECGGEEPRSPPARAGASMD